MPAEPCGSAHVATEATDTLLCRIADVACVYSYALACISLMAAAMINSAL